MLYCFFSVKWGMFSFIVFGWNVLFYVFMCWFVKRDMKEVGVFFGRNKVNESCWFLYGSLIVWNSLFFK